MELEAILEEVRIDNGSGMLSLVDVAEIVTGKSKNNAGEDVRIVLERDSHLHDAIVQLRINGKGRETYVADLKTTIQFIWALPGHHANEFKRECAEYLCRIRGGDLSIIDEVEKNASAISDETRDLILNNVPVCDAAIRELPRLGDVVCTTILGKRNFCELIGEDKTVNVARRMTEVDVVHHELDVERQRRVFVKEDQQQEDKRYEREERQRVIDQEDKRYEREERERQRVIDQEERERQRVIDQEDKRYEREERERQRVIDQEERERQRVIDQEDRERQRVIDQEARLYDRKRQREIDDRKCAVEGRRREKEDRQHATKADEKARIEAGIASMDAFLCDSDYVKLKDGGVFVGTDFTKSYKLYCDRHGSESILMRTTEMKNILTRHGVKLAVETVNGTKSMFYRGCCPPDGNDAVT